MMILMHPTRPTCIGTSAHRSRRLHSPSFVSLMRRAQQYAQSWWIAVAREYVDHLVLTHTNITLASIMRYTIKPHNLMCDGHAWIHYISTLPVHVRCNDDGDNHGADNTPHMYADTCAIFENANILRVWSLGRSIRWRRLGKPKCRSTPIDDNYTILIIEMEKKYVHTKNLLDWHFQFTYVRTHTHTCSIRTNHETILLTPDRAQSCNYCVCCASFHIAYRYRPAAARTRNTVANYAPSRLSVNEPVDHMCVCVCVYIVYFQHFLFAHLRTLV